MSLSTKTLLALAALTAAAAGEVTLSLTPDDFIVFTGSGEQVVGIEVISPASALIPIPSQNGGPNAAPFMFLLSNSDRHVAWGNLIETVTLDGQFVTQVGFDRNIGDPALRANWGDKSTATPKPVTISAAVLQPCTVDCPLPKLGIRLNDEGRFVLTAAGHQLEELNFRSPSGSLAPASSAAPFASTTINTPQQIQFTAGGTAVTLDGQVTLDAGWNDHLYTRDIVYDYREAGDTNTAEQRMSMDNYRLPTFAPLRVSINEENQFVLHGDVHPVSELTIWSRSLVASENAGPFGTQRALGNRLTYVADGTHLNIDGSVVLGAKWDIAEAVKDVFVDATLIGDLSNQSFRLRDADYPEVPSPPVQTNIVALSLDPDNNFVISANGVDISGLQFESPSGSLRPVPGSPAGAEPFQFLLSNTENLVVYGKLGDGVHIDGSVTLASGWDPAAETNDLVFQWGNGPRPVFVPIPSTLPGGTAASGLPAVSVATDRGIVLNNFFDTVKTFTLSSSNGALTPLEVPDIWTVLSNTASEITFSNEAGISAEEFADLQLTWSSTLDSAVFVSFTLSGGQSFGPYSLAANVLVPEPTSVHLGVLACLALLRRKGRRRSWGGSRRSRRSRSLSLTHQ